MRDRAAILATIGLYAIYFLVILAIIPPRGAGVPVVALAVLVFVCMAFDVLRGAK
jgi:hypothetical protein